MRRLLLVIVVVAAVAVLCAEATVRLRVESFDVKSSVGYDLNIRRHFNGMSDSDEDRQIFIAHMNPQLGTPWTEAMIQEASGHQGKLLHVPEHSFLFYGTPKDAYKIEALPIVDWVGKMHPRHRKSPIAYPQGYDPEKCRVEPEVQDGGVTVHEIVVMMFPVTPERTAVQARAMFDKWMQDLKNRHPLVQNVDYEFKFWTHDRVALKTKSSCLAAAAVEYLSSQVDVLDIERQLQYEPLMKYLKPVVVNGLTSSADVDSFYATGGSLLTDYNSLTGSGQIIAMADTGVQALNCYFACTTLTVQTDATLSTPVNVTTTGTGCNKFTGIVSRDGTYDDALSPHGTYIAGIMAGSAPNYNNKTEAQWWEGIAKDAKLFVMKIFSSNLSPSLYFPTSLQGFLQWPYANNAKIFVNAWNAINNCSLGFGCVKNSAYSNSSVVSQVYNSFALDFDQFATSNPDFLSVLAAGRSWCPSAPSSGVCQIAGPGNSKNVLTVGASMTTNQSYNILTQNYTGYFTDPQNYAAGFPSVWNIDGSSFVGPSTNSRKKPDVYAPGSHIITMNPIDTSLSGFTYSSCLVSSRTATLQGNAGDDLGYDYRSFGSSNAAAVAGGVLAIVRDWFARGYYSENNDNIGNLPRKTYPSAALMKAMIIHGAVYAPSGTVVQRKVMDQSGVSTGCSTTPRYDTITDVGFGFVRLSNTILITGTKKRIYLPGRSGSFVDNSNSSLNGTFKDPVFTAAGQIHTYTFCSKPITSTDHVDPKITLVWTDRVDTTQSSGALSNNLDLNVTYAGSTYYGNGGSSFDSINNVEQVSLTLQSTNKDLVVTVKATSLFSSYQPYALVVTGYVFNGSCASNPDPTTSVVATSFLSATWAGVTVLIWILISAGVCCLGVCACWAFCCVFWFKKVFIKEDLVVVKKTTNPDGTTRETIVKEELDVTLDPANGAASATVTNVETVVKLDPPEENGEASVHLDSSRA
eukprot:TRINITY_DN4444_c0_g1_i2.p1 TRINITY_DN4444_c0_g1~~TRINITY_DN4444_c0_g1_i2.p1  ORF type:complete len:971 (-),score=223.87 TRINITY_DN4444_c0_g1_i2:110-3022(-)